MHLAELIVNEYKGFEKATINFPEAGVVVVAGQNNSGKTALLGALDVIANAGTGDPLPVSRRFGARVDRPTLVTARFGLTDDERRSLFAGAVDIEKRVIESKAFQFLRWNFEDSGAGVLDLVSMHASAPYGMDASIAESRREGSDRIVAAVKLGDWLASPLSKHSDFQLELAGRGPGGVDLTGYMHSLDWLTPYTNLLRKWQTGFRRLSPSRVPPERSGPLRSTGVLDPSGANLLDVLLHCQSNEAKAWEGIRSAIAELVPECGELNVRTSSDTGRIVLTVGDRDDLDLADVGTGITHLLMIAYTIFTTPPGGFSVLEEPEAHLHPSGQRTLGRLLDHWSTGSTTVVASHSPALIGGSRDRPVWLTTRTEGNCRAQLADPGLAQVAAELGVDFTDLLAANRIIVTEAVEDAAVFNHWFADLIGNFGSAVIVGIGTPGGIAGHIDKVAALLHHIDGDLRLLFLRDRDELHPHKVARLQDEGNVWVHPVREMENYLLAPTAIAVAMASRPDQDPTIPMPSVDEIAGELRRAAADLKPLIVLKRINERRLAGDLRFDADVVAKSDDPRSAFLEMASANDAPAGDDLGALYDQQLSEVDSGWDTEWSTVAPGEELLKAVYRLRPGWTYQKTRDAITIARAIDASPVALRARITEFLT